MGRLAAVWKLASSWYVSLVVVAVVGVVVGSLVFYQVFPGKPKIGFIDIPFTVISSDSAFAISSFLDYTRRNDDIKAVVIRLESPGGGAASSEWLFHEVVKLREEKPVVIAMDGLVASGGFMMAMGANYTYVKTSSLIGNVGVFLSFPGPLVPTAPPEDLVTSGPHKLSGGSRRHWIGLVDELKESFAQIVITQRGERLLISPEQLTEGRLYSGVDAVRLGLADAIGADTEAIEKAASLAGISDYDMVDVNVEVFRLFNKKVRRIIDPLLVGDDSGSGGADLQALIALSRGAEESADPLGGVNSLAILRRQFLTSGIGESQQDALPGLPLDVNLPQVYYLYVGSSK